jgi:hypothetical protein
MKKTLGDATQMTATNFLAPESFAPEFGQRIGREANDGIFEAGSEIITLLLDNPSLEGAERLREILNDVYRLGARHATETLTEAARNWKENGND